MIAREIIKNGFFNYTKIENLTSCVHSNASVVLLLIA